MKFNTKAKIEIKDVLSIMGFLGCQIEHEFWYDEERVEGTSITKRHLP